MKALFKKDTLVVAGAGLEPLANVDLDDFELKVLEIARFFFENNEKPAGQTWKDAFRCAELAFPAPFGATIAHAVSLMVDALIGSRTRPFSYLSPGDSQSPAMLTDEEKYFVSTLHAVRRGQASHARAYAMMVCEGASFARLLTVCSGLSIVTGDSDSLRVE